MPIRRKLTAKLKEQIKADYRHLKLQDFDGDALTYLKKVRGAAKGRKAKRDAVAHVGETIIPKDSDLYSLIQTGAKHRKMSVKAFIKKYKDEIDALLKNGDFVLERESDKLIHDLASLKQPRKVYVNDFNGFVRTPSKEAILNIKLFVQYIMAHSDVFLVLFRTHFKLNGDVYFYLAPYEDIDGLSRARLIKLSESWLPWIKLMASAKKKKSQRAKRIRR